MAVAKEPTDHALPSLQLALALSLAFCWVGVLPLTFALPPALASLEQNVGQKQSFENPKIISPQIDGLHSASNAPLALALLDLEPTKL